VFSGEVDPVHRRKMRRAKEVAYDSTSLHRVAPVTRGERLVAIGWAQSYVRSSA